MNKRRDVTRVAVRVNVEWLPYAPDLAAVAVDVHDLDPDRLAKDLAREVLPRFGPE